ncbi:MAG: hypothetical protein LBF85_10400, partial [Tannerella sp.]|nr:hypothetical protein [Tannerella sp.]
MKAYKFYIVLSVITSMILTSCEDFLTKIPQNNLSVDSYFKSDNDYKLYTDGFYTYFTDKLTASYGSVGSGAPFDLRSDLISMEATKSGNEVFAELINGTQTPTSNSVSLFFDYAPIRRAYILFDNIDNIELDAASKNLYL